MLLVKRLVVVFALLVSSLLLAACGGSGDTDTKTASAAQLPDWAQNAPPRVRESYDYVVSHPDELAKYPCYCGCGAMGHTSNLSCYVQELAADGTITYDSHAMGCGICVDIAQDVMRLKAEGQSSPQVRACIDAKYSPFGPPTDTEFPLD